MSIPNLHTTIDYNELIKIQANQPISLNYEKRQNDTKQKVYAKNMNKKRTK